MPVLHTMQVVVDALEIADRLVLAVVKPVALVTAGEAVAVLEVELNILCT